MAPKLDCHVQSLLSAMHLEVEGIARLFGSHYGGQLVAGFQGLPVCLRDDVAAEPVGRAGEDDLHGAALQPRILGRAALANMLDEDALVETSLTVSIGMAKPMPTLPPDSLSICAFTPMTSPFAFRSGPPEFPWLMAASVWMA